MTRKQHFWSVNLSELSLPGSMLPAPEAFGEVTSGALGPEEPSCSNSDLNSAQASYLKFHTATYGGAPAR